MCGIIGILGEAEAQAAERMLAAISHRGQDASHFRWLDHFGAIGINRLSIIDLERGDQPIFNEDGTLALLEYAFNLPAPTTIGFGPAGVPGASRSA